MPKLFEKLRKIVEFNYPLAILAWLNFLIFKYTGSDVEF
jgi:hypothetical protein